MAVSMIGPKFYAWDRDGKPLAFGKLYTYQARTNTPKATYQSEDQVVENSNPVILNGEGYANVYLSGSYKMVLKDEKDNEIWSSDPVSSSSATEWVLCLTANYVTPLSFKLTGNFTGEYEPGRRVRVDNNASEYAYSTIESSIFAAGETTVTLTESVITTGIVGTCVSIVGPNSIDLSPGIAEVTDVIFNSVDDMKSIPNSAGVTLSEGMAVSWLGYYSEGGYGANFGVVKSGNHVEDGGRIFSVPNGLYVEAYLPLKAGQWGIVYDGETDAIAQYNAAKEYLAPLGMGLYFEGSGSVFFSGVRPDLSGLKLKSSGNVTFKGNFNPNVKEISLQSDIAFHNTLHETNLTKHKNRTLDYLYSAGASVKDAGYSQPEIIDFDDPEVTTSSISGANTRGPFTGGVQPTFINWGADFGSSQEGAFVPLELNTYFEVAFRYLVTTVVNPSNFAGITLPGLSERIDFFINTGAASYKVISSLSGTIETGTTPNGGAYSLSTNGSINMAVRITFDLVAEFYINGTLITSIQLNEIPVDIGFTKSWLGAQNTQILHLLRQRGKEPFSSQPINLSIVGDSISYGAWASSPYDQIIQATLAHAGVGYVTTDNVAVSGSTSADWATGGSIGINTIDLTGKDYCLIMLGTNDVQSNLSPIDYEANMRDIISVVQAAGAIPIIGLFPVWTEAAISGVTGVTTGNYSRSGYMRQVAKYVAADLGLKVAEVNEHFGTNLQWYGDNIHPTQEGQIAIAAAFSRAIIADRSSKKNLPFQKDITLGLINSWAAIGGNQPPKAKLNGNTVSLMGPITGGATGSVVAVLPEDMRPAFDRVCMANVNTNALDEGFAKIKIKTNGDIELESASVTVYVVWLDNVTFQLQ